MSKYNRYHVVKSAPYEDGYSAWFVMDRELLKAFPFMFHDSCIMAIYYLTSGRLTEHDFWGGKTYSEVMAARVALNPKV